jgi:hypothetical protein
MHLGWELPTEFWYMVSLLKTRWKTRRKLAQLYEFTKKFKFFRGSRGEISLRDLELARVGFSLAKKEP